MAAGHADRHEPLKDYCRGLLLPGERKSIEPMGARLHPDRVQAARQSIAHASGPGAVERRGGAGRNAPPGFARHAAARSDSGLDRR